MARFENGAFTHGFIYQDALNPVAELNENGTLRSLFVYGSKANTPDMIVKGADVYRVVSDLRGSVRRVVNVSTGQVVQALDYDAWGRVLSDSNPGFQPFGYAGGLYDPATQLVRFGARDYDPFTGRWTAKDPILFSGGDSDLYAYVGGDPINYFDPEGRSPVGIGIACAVLAVAIYHYFNHLSKGLEAAEKKDQADADLLNAIENNDNAAAEDAQKRKQQAEKDHLEAMRDAVEDGVDVIKGAHKLPGKIGR